MLRSERLTVEEAAALLGVQPATVREHIRDGTLRAHRVRTREGDVYLIERHHLESLRAATPYAPPPDTEADAPALSAASQDHASTAHPERNPELFQQTLNRVMARLDATSQELANEQARRVELEELVQQLEESLAASQEQVAMLANRKGFAGDRARSVELEGVVRELQEQLAGERTRRIELEALIRQSEERLAAAQQQQSGLVDRSDLTREQARRIELEQLVEHLKETLGVEQVRRTESEELVRRLEGRLVTSQRQADTSLDQGDLTHERTRLSELERMVQQLTEDLQSERRQRAELERLTQHVATLAQYMQRGLVYQVQPSAPTERPVQPPPEQLQQTEVERTPVRRPEPEPVQPHEEAEVPARPEKRELVPRGNAPAPACPFLQLSGDPPSTMCLSRREDVMSISARYAQTYCLTARHTDCPRFLDAD